MVHIAMSAFLAPDRTASPFSESASLASHSVLIVRDDDKNNHLLDTICEFLGVGVEHVSSEEYLAPLLCESRPMAVIADLAGRGQDGFHVMMAVAAHDRTLPVLLLTGDDPALLGAVDAVQEIWGLSRVMTMTDVMEMKLLVDFLCHAARDAGMARMMRI